MNLGWDATGTPLCFYGTYPTSYTVSRILEKAAREAGFPVLRCHEQFVEEPLTSPQFGRLWRLMPYAARYAGAARRLRRQLDRCPAEILIAGFRGQFDVLLARLLNQTRSRRIVFAPLVTLLETGVDRGLVADRSRAARLLAWLDRKSLELSQRVVIDTYAHADYLQAKFGTRRDKIRVFHLGCDTDVFRQRAVRPQESSMRVLFYGSLLPLHGVETIVTAASLLRREPRIQFTICGEGWCRPTPSTRIGELENIRWMSWVSYEKIPDLIEQHDVCLGVFSGNEKAAMVIPNKVYQSAAVGRTVVSANTPAIREVFTHGENIWLVPPGHPEALADALLYLLAHPGDRAALASRAAEFMGEQFSSAAQAERFAVNFVAGLN
ncbi:MAG: hypothetical protein KatS3mg077_3131 [Candidatus Binatia bacterium]|nr:MAG: hypothetical protein KatS3mg077_3131 [Candidatus Binatia bacterium]